MAKDIGTDDQSSTFEATLRSTVDEWGITTPTQTRSQRATEALNALDNRAQVCIAINDRGGRWVIAAKQIANEILNRIELYDTWFIDYQLTPSQTDSSGALYGIPFGDWANLGTTIDIPTITDIAEQ